MWRPSWSIRLPHAAAILYALLAVVLVNLAYLAMEVSGQAACSWMLVAGRLVLTGVLLVPGAYLLGGGELLSLHRYSPVLAVLGSAALALVTAGHGRDLALGYLGFFSAVPLLYVLLFPERPFGALACSSTLAAASLPLVLHFDTAVDFNIQLFGTQALSAGVASYAALATRRARARETAGVVARTGAFKKLALSEARRVRSARLAAAGAVADKVAHDLNSPLAALRSNLRFALDEGATGQSAESDAALADAIACASRIEAVIGRLRSDALVVSHPATSCDLAAAARAALEEARPRLPSEISVALDLPAASPVAVAVRPLLVDAISQLLLAAAEGHRNGAMRLGFRPAASAIRLEVSSSWEPGARIHDGLALATCELFAERIGATLDLDDAGHGTGFALVLPLRSAPEAIPA